MAPGLTVRTWLINLALASTAIATSGNGSPIAAGGSDELPRVTIGDLFVSEPASGNAPYSWRLQLSKQTPDTVRVPYLVASCTATLGTDFLAIGGGEMVFAPFQLEATNQFQVVGDGLIEGHEIFSVLLGTPENAVLADDYGQVTIAEADGPVLGAVRADFDGDGHNDAVWYDRARGAYGIWRLAGLTRLRTIDFAPAAPAEPEWVLVGVDDFDADTQPDLLFRHVNKGVLQIWFMSGTVRVSTRQIIPEPDPTWSFVGTARFDGNSTPDLLFRTSEGRMVAWLLDGLDLVDQRLIDPPAPVDANWLPQLLADFDADGDSDLMFRNANSGALVVWFLDGTVRVGAQRLNAVFGDLNWRLVGAFDADADGTTDLAWQDGSSGRVAVWLLDAALERRCAGYVVPETPTALRSLWVGPR